MSTVTTYLPAWEPPAGELAWFRPVQVENTRDGNGGLSMVQLPSNEALLMWSIGGQVHFAIIDSPIAALQDNIVSAGDIQVAWVAGVAVDVASPFLVNDELYFIAMLTETSSTWHSIKVFKADDPNAPTNWNLHGTVHTGATRPWGSDFGGPPAVSHPYITAGGRWVVEGGKFYNGSFGGSNFCGFDAGFWTSDNNGVSWTLRHTYTRGGPAHSISSVPQHLVRDPVTSDIVGESEYGSGTPDGIHIIRSANDGTSWSNTTNGFSDMQFIVSTDIEMYSFFNGDELIYRSTDGGANWTDTGTAIWPNAFFGTSMNNYTGTQRIGCRWPVIEDTVYFFARDVVAGRPRGWLIDSVGI